MKPTNRQVFIIYTNSIPFQKYSEALFLCQLFFFIFAQPIRLKYFSFFLIVETFVIWVLILSNKWFIKSSVGQGEYLQLVPFLGGPALFHFKNGQKPYYYANYFFHFWTAYETEMLQFFTYNSILSGFFLLGSKSNLRTCFEFTNILLNFCAAVTSLTFL